MKMFKFEDDGIPLPLRSSDRAAGLDFRSPVNITLYPKDSEVIDTGVGFVIDPGWGGLVLGRSGMGIRYSIESRTGLIDEDYIGSVRVKLYNYSDRVYFIKQLDKFAQIIFVPMWMGPVEITTLDKVMPTERGDKGFGSTGVS